MYSFTRKLPTSLWLPQERAVAASLPDREELISEEP